MREAEAREVFFRGGGQKIKLLDPCYLSALQQALDKPPTDPASTMLRRNYGRAKQSDCAKLLEPNRAGDFSIVFGYEEAREVVPDSVNRKIARREQLFDGGQIRVGRVSDSH
jgi:hypothetical protein